MSIQSLALTIFSYKLLFKYYHIQWGTADGATVVKALRYKSEGGWFDSR
jgi:hypothetical protein